MPLKMLSKDSKLRSFFQSCDNLCHKVTRLNGVLLLALLALILTQLLTPRQLAKAAEKETTLPLTTCSDFFDKDPQASQATLLNILRRWFTLNSEEVPLSQALDDLEKKLNPFEHSHSVEHVQIKNAVDLVLEDASRSNWETFLDQARALFKIENQKRTKIHNTDNDTAQISGFSKPTPIKIDDLDLKKPLLPLVTPGGIQYIIIHDTAESSSLKPHGYIAYHPQIYRFTPETMSLEWVSSIHNDPNGPSTDEIYKMDEVPLPTDEDQFLFYRVTNKPDFGLFLVNIKTGKAQKIEELEKGIVTNHVFVQGQGTFLSMQKNTNNKHFLYKIDTQNKVQLIATNMSELSSETKLELDADGNLLWFFLSYSKGNDCLRLKIEVSKFDSLTGNPLLSEPIILEQTIQNATLRDFHFGPTDDLSHFFTNVFKLQDKHWLVEILSGKYTHQFHFDETIDQISPISHREHDTYIHSYSTSRPFDENTTLIATAGNIHPTRTEIQISLLTDNQLVRSATFTFPGGFIYGKPYVVINGNRIFLVFKKIGYKYVAHEIDLNAETSYPLNETQFLENRNNRSTSLFLEGPNHLLHSIGFKSEDEIQIIKVE